MSTAGAKAPHVLLVHPASLWGATWADGQRVKPELVSIFTHLRRAGVSTMVADLEVELGNPVVTEQTHFLEQATARLFGEGADVVAFDCWTAQQYSATVALAEALRRERPQTVIAVWGYHPTVRPDDFTYDGTPFNWLLEGEAENALRDVVEKVAGGDRDVSGCRVVVGAPLAHTAEDAPDYAAYHLARPGMDSLGIYLSRGCPYHVTACQLRPGGSGWHGFAPEVALQLLDELTALQPKAIDILDPSFGYDAAWRTAVLERMAAVYHRTVPISIRTHAEALTRKDLDKIYAANLRLRLDLETLSVSLLSRRETVPSPARAVEHAVDLITYANAKGIATTVGLVFNQPGETEETAAETLEVLRQFAAAAPNASVRVEAESWAYFPYGTEVADIEAPRQRYGTELTFPQWWKEQRPSEQAAKAVVASTELAGLLPGDESYWRPRFTSIAHLLESKLTSEARRGLRSHESVGSAAADVPHGWWNGGRSG